MVLNVKGADGNPIAIYQTGSVGANLGLGGNQDYWNATGFNPDRITKTIWPLIVGAESTATLTVTTDGAHIIDLVLEALGVAVVAVLVAAIPLIGPGGQQWTCDPPTAEITGGGQSGVGVQATLQCHPKGQ